MFGKLCLWSFLVVFLCPLVDSGDLSAQLVEKDLGFPFEEPGFFSMPSAMAYDGIRNRIAFADKGRNLVYIFNLADQSSEVFGERQDITEPLGLAFNLNGDLLVTQAQNSAILRYRFGTDTPEILPLTGIDVPGGIHPGRISVDFRDIIYLADREAAIIYMIDRAGNLLGKITEKLRRPGGVMALPSGEIVVADKGIDPLLVFGPGGEFIRRLSRPESPAGKFSYSTAGLAIDQRGWTYTLDISRSRVVYFDPTGVSRTEWAPEEPPFFPVDIAIDRSDNIFVLESGAGCVRVFVRAN